MSKAHDAVVRGQFGPRAKAYVQSAVHAHGADLTALEAVVEALKPGRALDLGCGGGHVAYLLARHARQVAAVDLSAEMLAAVTKHRQGQEASPISKPIAARWTGCHSRMPVSIAW